MNSLEATQVTAPNGKTDDCAKFTIDTANSTYTFQDITTADQKYVFGCYVKSDAAGSVLVGDETTQTSASWTRLVYKFTASDVDFVITFPTAGTYYVYNSKLEIGTVDTDWSPAPEDVDSDISDVGDSIDQVGSDLNDYKTETDEQLANIIVGQNGITQQVTDLNNNVNIIEQTVEGTTQTIGNLEDKYLTMETTMDGFEVRLDNAEDDNLDYVINGRPSSTGTNTVAGWTKVSGAFQRTFPGGESHVDIGFFNARKGWSAGTVLQLSIEARITSGTFSSSDYFLFGIDKDWKAVRVDGLTTSWKSFSAICEATQDASRFYTSSYVTSSGSKVIQIRNLSAIPVGGASSQATDYLKFDSSGLYVGNYTGTLQGNVRLYSDGIEIRNGSTVYQRLTATRNEMFVNGTSYFVVDSSSQAWRIGDGGAEHFTADSSASHIRNGSSTLSSFTGSYITIGENSSSSYINLCGGQCRIDYKSSRARFITSGSQALYGNATYANIICNNAETNLGSSNANSSTNIRGKTIHLGSNINGNPTIQAYYNGYRNLVPAYRLYNSYDKDHIITSDASERSNLINQGWHDDGICFYVFQK